MARILTTVEDVVRTVGGHDTVAGLIGISYSGVCNWIVAGRMPPRTYVALTVVLAARGATAPPALWQMVPAPADLTPFLREGAA